MLDELEYRLAVGQGGIVQLAGLDGMNNRIREWLATPEGTMADKPRWGHNLRQFQFDPPGPIMAIEMELSVVRKIRQDVADVTVRAIGITIDDIDLINLTIIHDMGIFREQIPLKEATGG